MKVIVAVAAWSLALQFVALIGTQYFNTLPHPGQGALTFAWQWWDGRFFQRIVAYWYWAHPGSQESPGVLLRAAFYPGYPLLARGVYEILQPLGISVTGAMLLTNQLLVFPMAVLVYLMGSSLTKSREIGERTVYVLLLFPFAYFLLAPYSEATFLTLVAGFAWALTTRRYAIAAAFAAGAGATRPVGIILAAILAVGYLEQHRWRIRALFRTRPLLYMGVSVSGFVAWAAYQWKVTGTPFYAERMERIGWQRSFTLRIWHPIHYAFEPQPLTAGPFSSVPLEATTMIGLLVLFTWLSVLVWRRFGAPMGLMCGLFLLASLCTGTLFSFNRYVLPLLPAFVVLAGWTRWRTFDFVYKTIGATLLALFLVLYTHGVWTG